MQNCRDEELSIALRIMRMFASPPRGGRQLRACGAVSGWAPPGVGARAASVCRGTERRTGVRGVSLGHALLAL